jgi:Flp pilus assembly protein TadG
MRMSSSARGQATVETIALVPLLLIVGLGLMQLLAVGYASVLAGSAAEAGALALAGGTDPRAAALRSLPGWSEAHTKIDVEGGRVEIRLRPPSVLQALGERLEVGAAAEVEEP